MTTTSQSDRARLRTIAIAAMRDRGLEPNFPSDALTEVSALTGPAQTAEEPTRDLRALLWCSIDNDDSRDLDQLSVAEELPGGDTRVLVAVADVDAVVRPQSAVDRHASQNTTSVYTPALIFPMLPERLSTDLTSLADQQDRLAIVVEFTMSTAGEMKSSSLYGATVRNRAKLAYNSVGSWLAGTGPLPPAAAAQAGMDRQLQIQDRVAQSLDQSRRKDGALEFASDEVQHVFDGEKLSDLTPETSNRAKALIENLMIAANGVVARFLASRGVASLRRVVRSPERWDRIRELAARTNDTLPENPDSLALAGYLKRRQDAAPESFLDLSRMVIKLLGSGEYVVDPPGGDAPGHFGLAVRDYTHSTAPNRRYPDLITQRLLKAVLAGHAAPYSIDQLEWLADHCTKQEDAANKVERQVRKSAAAILVESRIGERFDAIVTGASSKGTYVRVASPPFEGKLVTGARGHDVGDRLRVRLVDVNVDRGFIDFAIA
jgi:VacB/RNase II family 3'-5' exoribonuclease